MATTITGISKSKAVSNLDTYNHTAGQASMYTVSLDLSEQPPSGCVITMSQNGTPKLATSTPAATQLNIKASVVMNCAVSDVISIAITSSTPSDITINSIKGTLRITPGQY